jgi:DNA transposition AAA+ family ATPase
VNSHNDNIDSDKPTNKVKKWCERIRLIRIMRLLLCLLILAQYTRLTYWQYGEMQESEAVIKIVYVVGYAIVTVALLVATIKVMIARRRRKNARLAPVAYNELMPCMKLKKIRYNPDEENHLLVYLDGKGRSIKQVRKSQDELRSALKVKMIKGYSTKGDTIIVNCMIDKDKLMGFINWCQCKFARK